MPGLTHGNLNRGEKYVNSVIQYGLKAIFTSDDWLDFYREYDIKVNFYGDFQYLEEVTSKYNSNSVINWCNNIKNITENNKSRRLFWGFACSNSIETFRIIRLSIDYYLKNQKIPTDKDIIKLYYGEYVDKIDIFIRPGEIRDSDCQPPLLGGNAQFYFTISPLTELDKNFFRKILYDYLYCRLITFSKKQYSNLEIGSNDLQFLEKYYYQNRDNIIGLGKKISLFWLPKIDLKEINNNLRKQNNNYENG
jgi:hypothetical protein